MKRRAVIMILAAAMLLPATLAAEPREYAYVFLQGKLTDSSTARPLERAFVRLTTNTEAFETTTDSRGVFTFEKLPLGQLPTGELPFVPFELRIVTPEGKVIRGIQRSDPDDPDGTRFRIRMGKGYGGGIRIEATRERVTVNVPEPHTRWSKLWAEFGIFIGVAGLLAL